LLYDTLLEVRDSALKHGCSADDIRHAITNALAIYDDLDDPYVLYLDPDTAGTLLEVLTAVRLPPEVRRALDDRAAEEHTSTSEVIRRALEQYLAS
jgi:plasmid stability protein